MALAAMLRSTDISCTGEYLEAVQTQPELIQILYRLSVHEAEAKQLVRRRKPGSEPLHSLPRSTATAPRWKRVSNPPEPIALVFAKVAHLGVVDRRGPRTSSPSGPPLPRSRESPMCLLAVRSAAACKPTCAVARADGAGTRADVRVATGCRPRAVARSARPVPASCISTAPARLTQPRRTSTQASAFAIAWNEKSRSRNRLTRDPTARRAGLARPVSCAEASWLAIASATTAASGRPSLRRQADRAERLVRLGHRTCTFGGAGTREAVRFRGRRRLRRPCPPALLAGRAPAALKLGRALRDALLVGDQPPHGGAARA